MVYESTAEWWRDVFVSKKKDLTEREIKPLITKIIVKWLAPAHVG